MKNNYFKNSFKLLKNNITTIICFEFILKIIVSSIVVPLSIAGFNFTMKLTGFSYLSSENIVSFIINPISILFIIIIVFFITFMTIFDITTLIVIFDQSYQNNKIKVIDAIKISLSKCKKLFKSGNILIAFLVLFLIPFLHIGIESIVITSINIPKFITDYIISNKILFIALVFLLVIITILLMKWIYALHYMVLENKTFKSSRMASSKLIEKSIIKDILRQLIVQIIIYLVYLILIIAGVYVITFFYKILSNHQIIESILITIIWIFVGISLLIFSICSNAISYAILSSLFYKHKKDNKRIIKSIDFNKTINKKGLGKFTKAFINIIIIISLMGGSIFTYQIVSGKFDVTNLNAENIEITAHRGASNNYPENTMPAFIGAKEMNADWIELDIHQSKDLKLVVLHDASFKRVANVNKKVSELNYNEIQKIDIGGYFSEEFKGVSAPLLEDVIKYAKENDIKLNIEVKPTGTEVDIEKQIIDLINAYDFKDNCVVASFSYEVLENVKNIDSSINTLYVMSFAIGNIIDLSAADSYSIEASNIKYSLVGRIHNSGKKLFVWTINDEDTMRKMIELNVDNIITDDIELAKNTIYNNEDINIANEIIKLLTNI